MTAPQFFSGLYGSDAPARAASAPPKLDSSTLFAYHVSCTQTEYANAFTDIRNDDLYGEFYQYYKETEAARKIPPPLEEGLETLRISAPPGDSSDGPKPRKLSVISENECDTGQNRSRSTSFLVKDVVDVCIKEEDSPKAFQGSAFGTYSTEVADFAPGFYPDGYMMQTEDQDVLTNAYEMAKDQMGCRVLQRKLESNNEYIVRVVFSQTLLHFAELMVHPFGNYLCQKMIEVCSESQLKMLLDLIAPQLFELSLDPHGTRVVQKIIEIFGQTDCISQVATSLEPHSQQLITDMNGNHVVQRFLSACSPGLNQFIYDAVCANIFPVATNRHGCCVLQRCIDSASEFQRESLVSCIVENAVALVQDAYGNYAVQYVLDLNLPSVNARLGHIFTQQIVVLSEQKFSSNVIEKCLQQNKPEVQELMIREIAKPRNVGEMIVDQYANYVVQRALTLAAPRLQKDLLAVLPTQGIKSNLDQLKRSQFGKRVYSKLVKKYPELSEARHYP